MRLILAEAIRRKFTFASLVAASEIDRKTLYDLVEAEDPKPERIARFISAFGLAPHVARALCNQLSQRDREEIRSLVHAQVAIYCAEPETNAELDNVFDGLSLECRNEVLAAFVLAQSGLDEPQEARIQYYEDYVSYPLLPAGLLAVDMKLSSFGFAFRLRDRVDEDAESKVRGAESNAALFWLCRVLRLSDAKRSEIQRLIQFEGPFELYETEAFESACVKAIKAFREALPAGARLTIEVTPVSDFESEPTSGRKRTSRTSKKGSKT